jgi:hypothetical protein
MTAARPDAAGTVTIRMASDCEGGRVVEMKKLSFGDQYFAAIGPFWQCVQRGFSFFSSIFNVRTCSGVHERRVATSLAIEPTPSFKERLLCS